ncbi:MAG: OmpA family protein [Treponema sp.]|nr:OmpA family protein [Treponema sp.]
MKSPIDDIRNHHKSISLACIVLYLMCTPLSLGAQTQEQSQRFVFSFTKGDSYRMLSTVNEDVSINHVRSHHSEIVSRVTVHIEDVDSEGNGIHKATFMTSDEARGAVTGTRFTWSEEYQSEYKKNPNGELTIDDSYFMPVVRNMPIFPDQAVSVGDTWKATGYEAHDLRRTFDLQKPYIVPFEAEYTYEGPVTNNGKTLHLITAQYALYYESPRPEIRTGQPYSDFPTATSGYSYREIYWDAQKGAIDHYDEEFKIAIETAYGNLFQFIGTTHVEITEFTHIATPQNVQKLQQQIEQLNITDVSVKTDQKGLTLSLENIQFKPDSAELLDSEKEKIKKIAGLLKAYDKHDLLITGHTALAGKTETRKILSEQRAQAVADFLISLGVKDAYHIFTRGLGASQPIASNKSDAGKAKNRRVEITIMDK